MFFYPEITFNKDELAININTDIEEDEDEEESPIQKNFEL